LCRYQRLVFKHKLYQLREERDMKPETFASLVSAMLYEKRSALFYLSNLNRRA
jgi:20S proteasome alpha/beta subunit